MPDGRPCSPDTPCPPLARVVGDIHGDLQKVLQCLELAGVLEEQDGHIHWVGGDTTVVQMGDVLDRGDSEIGALLQLRLAGFAHWLCALRSCCLLRRAAAAEGRGCC